MSFKRLSPAVDWLLNSCLLITYNFFTFERDAEDSRLLTNKATEYKNI